MARDLNKVMVIGRLGRDPEMRYTPTGRPVTTFSVASSRSWTTSEGEHRTETEWFNIVAWGGLAEICNQYLEKGNRVYVEGRLQTRRWEDQTGARKSITEVVANEMIMLTRKPTRPEAAHSEIEEEDAEFDLTPESQGDEFPF
jgi:single-strand DNA-binding protein